MTTIIGIAGSVRNGSYNAALLRAAADVVPQGCVLEIASIKDIPLYNGDLEASQGIPGPVTELKDRIANAGGLLLVTPEYNNSLPGVLKNAIDWLTRPPTDIRRVFRDRSVGIIGTTPGALGTRLAQTAWLPVFRALGMRPWFGSQLYVGNASKVFDASGNLVEDDIRERLTAYMTGFAAFVAS
ncbi:MAG: NADPH-dependent FMN reductase [Acidiferrobacterales bacterium]